MSLGYDIFCLNLCLGEKFLTFLFTFRQSLSIEFLCQFLQFVLHVMCYLCFLVIYRVNLGEFTNKSYIKQSLWY